MNAHLELNQQLSISVITVLTNLMRDKDLVLTVTQVVIVEPKDLKPFQETAMEVTTAQEVKTQLLQYPTDAQKATIALLEVPMRFHAHQENTVDLMDLALPRVIAMLDITALSEPIPLLLRPNPLMVVSSVPQDIIAKQEVLLQFSVPQEHSLISMDRLRNQIALTVPLDTTVKEVETLRQQEHVRLDGSALLALHQEETQLISVLQEITVPPVLQQKPLVERTPTKSCTDKLRASLALLVISALLMPKKIVERTTTALREKMLSLSAQMEPILT